MDLVRRAVSACLLALALLAVAVPAQAADGRSVTEEIFRDYALDRVIDGHYGASDLEATLDLARDDPAFREFADAVQETYDRDMLGLSTDPDPQPFAAERSGDALLLPEPSLPGERDQPPWPFLALTALAGALVLTGAGSSILRRARR
ncbi:hypothetical protein [Miltoncostaea oceani]|uniref:hypothetical protein n=1 Tax=Miltoncostaea oceani TaxID=2843216 RepID=UPI001C3D9BBF|nr:hypothetical protein [Miltoncostaea oceani]